MGLRHDNQAVVKRWAVDCLSGVCAICRPARNAPADRLINQ
jgi:hypothetical protein